MLLHFIFMARDVDLARRRDEFEYVRRMAQFFKVWISDTFSVSLEVRCDEMATGRRGILERLDTHTLVKDHRHRGEQVYHFYLCHFRPTWTDCTCEGYHAENFGMVHWQRPKDAADALFLAEKNCTTVSHELAHELLRQKNYGRFIQDVHDVWTRHFHDDLPFEQYGADYRRTCGRPEFLTLDASSFRNAGMIPD